MDPHSANDRQPGAAPPAARSTLDARYPTPALGGIAPEPASAPAWATLPVPEPPVWIVPPAAPNPDPPGMRLLVSWHILLGVGFGLLTLAMGLLALMSLLGEGEAPPLGAVIRFYLLVFLSLALPLLGCVGCIALSRGLERRQSWAATTTMVLHSLLILTLGLLALAFGIWVLVPIGGVLIAAGVMVLGYLCQPATRALFGQA